MQYSSLYVCVSNGRLSEPFCRWQGGRFPETSPAQRDSKIYILKTSPAQRDSGISILKNSPYSPYRPYRPLDFKTTPAQLDSKMSNGRLSEPFCRWQGGRFPETSPAQRDSGMSKLRQWNIIPQRTKKRIFTMPIKNIAGWFMGLWTDERIVKKQNAPAQRDSGISILKIET